MRFRFTIILISLLPLIGKSQPFGKLTVSFRDCFNLPLDQFEIRADRGSKVLGKTDTNGVFEFNSKVVGEIVVSHPKCVNAVLPYISQQAGSDNTCAINLKPALRDSMMKQVMAFRCDKKELLTPDTPAQFPGGPSAMSKFVQDKISDWHWNPYLDEIPGKIYVSFIVSETGKITCAEMTRSSGNFCFDQEVIKTVYSFPDFVPAQLTGRALASSFAFPIQIHWKE